MSGVLLPARQRAPRRARYLIPLGTPRRREAVAALGLLALLAGLLLAQVTLGLAVGLHATGKLTRWRPAWLAIPAAAGMAWMLATGPAAAVAGLTAAPRAVVRLLFQLAADPAQLAHLGSLSVHPARLLPGQFPAGLILSTGVAAVAWWLDWLHTDEWRLPAQRPGLVVTSRRWLTAAFIRSGGVLSRAGACLGVVPATGRPAVVGWPEAERCVLVTGAALAATAGPGFQLAHAAIRLRKPVIVVDLAADPGLPGLLAAACAAAGAPLVSFTAAGPGYYDPFPGSDPAGNAALALGMIDWAGAPEPVRQGAQSVLADAFAVAGAAPADGGRAMLDDVVALLRPGALQARMSRVPGYYPGRAALAARVAAGAAQLAADPAIAGVVAEQLAGVRSSPLGRWLGTAPPGGDGCRISLASVIRQRGAALFSLGVDAHGAVAGIIASLVARDLAGVFNGLRQAGTGGDGLAWFSQCEAADPQALAAMVTAGTGTGLATVVSTTSAAAAGSLAGQADVLVVHRLADSTLASQLAGLTGRRLVPAGPRRRPGGGQPGYLVAAGGWLDPAAASGAGGLVPAGPVPAGLVPAGMVTPGPVGTGLPLAAPPGAAWAPVVTGEAMCALRDGEFILIRRAAPDGVVPLAVSVPARIPGGRQPVTPAWSAGDRGPTEMPPARAAGPAGPAAPPQAAAAAGDRQSQPPHQVAQPDPGAVPPAASGAPPWPNAPAWAGGDLRRDRPR